MSRQNDTSSSSTATGSTNKQLQSTDAMCYHCFEVLIDTLEGNHNYISGSSSTKRSSNTNSGGWNPFRNSGSSNNMNNHKKPSTLSIPEFVGDLPHPSIECPLFITWEKSRPKTFMDNLLPNNNNNPPQQQDNNNGDTNNSDSNVIYELRGCIGSLSAKPLLHAIGDYALNSALKDRRFSPIHPAEIAQLRVAVSLLVQYEVCEDCFDWVVGTHGIVVRFTAGGRDYSATYLPEVALDQHWNQKDAVSALMRKAGYNPPNGTTIDDALLRQVACTRYQSSKRKMTHEEYLQRKQQQQSASSSSSVMNNNNTPGNNTGDRSLPSTQPSSASSSFYQTTVDTIKKHTGEGDEEQQYHYAHHPGKQWNTCNNL